MNCAKAWRETPVGAGRSAGPCTELISGGAVRPAKGRTVLVTERQTDSSSGFKPRPRSRRLMTCGQSGQPVRLAIARTSALEHSDARPGIRPRRPNPQTGHRAADPEWLRLRPVRRQAPTNQDRRRSLRRERWGHPTRDRQDPRQRLPSASTARLVRRPGQPSCRQGAGARRRHSAGSR